MLPNVSGEFTVVSDPELRFTPSGVAVANLRLAANKRKKVNDEWVDDKVCFLNGTAWKQMAENVAESIEKGMSVIITGALETRPYETKEGEKRQSYDLQIYSIGPSLAWASARVTKASRSGPSESASSGDPWSTGGAPSSDEPPF